MIELLATIGCFICVELKEEWREKLIKKLSKIRQQMRREEKGRFVVERILLLLLLLLLLLAGPRAACFLIQEKKS